MKNIIASFMVTALLVSIMWLVFSDKASNLELFLMGSGIAIFVSAGLK